ncbi:PAS domain S-box protein [Caldithrix abyssi]
MIFLARYQKTALQIVLIFVAIGLLWLVLFSNILPELTGFKLAPSLVYFVFLILAALYLYKALSVPLEKSEQISRALSHNERKYRTLVEEINEVIFVIDQMGRITYISPAITLLTGFSPNELIGRLFVEFIDPRDEETVFKAFKERLRGQVAPLQYRILSKDGSSRWVRSLSKPYKNEQGNIGVRGVLMDVTDLVEKDMALIESEARWRALVEQAPDYIITTDLKGKIEFVNRSFFNVPEKQIIGQMIHDLVPTTQMKRVQEAIEKVTQKGGLHRFEIELNVEGQKHWYLVRTGPIKKNDVIVGLTFIATEITRNKNYERELEEIQAHLQKLVSERTLELKSANREIRSLDRLINEQLKDFETRLTKFLEKVESCAVQSAPPHLKEIQKEAERIKKQFAEIYRQLKEHGH